MSVILKKKETQLAGIDSYRKTEVLTANRETLLLMLYSAAIRFTNLAMDAIEQNKPQQKIKYIAKARDIVLELLSTLNHRIDGALASSLETLYDYVLHCYSKAWTTSTIDPLKEAAHILNTLNSAWEQAVEKLRKEEMENQQESKGGNHG